MSDETVPKEQLETAMRFLEWSHGDALERPWSDEAHAYYMAIGILEDALDENLRPAEDIMRNEREKEAIQRSREAREAGYREATAMKREQRQASRDGLFETVKTWVAQ